MSHINQKLGLKPAGQRSMMKLPTDRALRNRVTAAQCPKCHQRRAHLSKVHGHAGDLVCEWCGHVWPLEPTA